MYIMRKMKQAVNNTTRFFTNVKWSLYRAHKRQMFRLIEYLVKRYKWHNNVLDTSLPNVPFLKVKSITVVNGYGQEHTHTF